MKVPLITPSALLDFAALRWRRFLPLMRALDSCEPGVRLILNQTDTIKDILAIVGLCYLSTKGFWFTYSVLSDARTKFCSSSTTNEDVNQLDEWAINAEECDSSEKKFYYALDFKMGSRILIRSHVKLHSLPDRGLREIDRTQFKEIKESASDKCLVLLTRANCSVSSDQPL